MEYKVIVGNQQHVEQQIGVWAGHGWKVAHLAATNAGAGAPVAIVVIMEHLAPPAPHA